MAHSRLDLQSLLEAITEHVYFQPPANIRIDYPCIVYSRDGSDVDRADNVLYRHAKRYQVTVIDRNPDSDLPDKVEELPLCQFDRFFPAENLNHFVFNLFF
jgi:hypothetical protein